MELFRCPCAFWVLPLEHRKLLSSLMPYKEIIYRDMTHCIYKVEGERSDLIQSQTRWVGSWCPIYELDLLKQVRLWLMITIHYHKWYWLAVGLRKTCLLELYFKVLLGMILYIGGRMSGLLDLINGHWGTCPLEDVSSQNGYMSVITTNRVEPFRDLWMNAPVNREKVKCDLGSYVVKRAWPWEQKNLGLNSHSPLANHTILGQLLSCMVLQMCHHRMRLRGPASVFCDSAHKHLASGLVQKPAPS